MSKARVEAFSDGVFAIAITLLVLTVAQPRTYRNLAHELGAQWPSRVGQIESAVATLPDKTQMNVALKALPI